MIQVRKWSKKTPIAQPASGGRTLARSAAIGLLMLTPGCSSDTPPSAVPLEARTPKVLVIGIDGVRPDVLADVSTPNLDRLVEQGTFTARTRTTTPSVSGPAWSSMLTGVWPDKHGVLSNDFTAPRYDRFPSFLTRVERARPDLRTFAVVDWTPLMDLQERDAVLAPPVDVLELLDGYELGWREADARSVTLAEQELQENDPDALFVYLGDPDETSHQHGSIGVEYRDAIARADQEVGRLVAAVERRPTHGLENWLILVSTDHGRREDGGHGGESPAEMTTFIIASGPGAALGTWEAPSAIVDIAVTALTHLGIPIDPAWALDGIHFGLR
ncbi:MAG: alkaline phosphatase family protein [Gemmatimonadota bacterium]|nr:alkaline phosphatase family protein [Gemmatimonadota bacterium]